MYANELDEIGRITFAERGKFYKYLSAIDLCVCSFIIAPLTIAFWSSSWSILLCIDAAYANKKIQITAITAAFGFSFSLIFTLLQKQIKAVFTVRVDNNVLYFLGSRLYTYVFAFASVCTWFGIWSAVDILSGRDSIVILAVVIISYVGLILTRTSCNVKSIPFALAIDDEEEYFDAPTYFHSLHQHGKRNGGLIVFDMIFTVLTVGTLVSVIWRGTWFLLDEEILKFKDIESSNFCSLGIGYSVAFFTYFLQSPVERWVRKTKGWKGLIILDIYAVFLYCGSINVWRGVWNTIVVYTRLEESLSISILLQLGSFLILVSVRTSNSLPLRGVVQENVDKVEECVGLPKYYRSKLFVHQGKRAENVESCKDTAMQPKTTTDGKEANRSSTNEKCGLDKILISPDGETTEQTRPSLTEASATVN